MRDISSTRNKGFDMPFNYKSKKRSPKKNAVTRENEIWNIEIIHVDAPTRSLVLIAIDADLRRPLIAAVTSGTAKDIFAKLAGVGRHVGYPKKIWLDFGSEIPPAAASGMGCAPRRLNPGRSDVGQEMRPDDDLRRSPHAPPRQALLGAQGTRSRSRRMVPRLRKPP
jgi:hypothetical protein